MRSDKEANPPALLNRCMMEQVSEMERDSRDSE